MNPVVAKAATGYFLFREVRKMSKKTITALMVEPNKRKRQF